MRDLTVLGEPNYRRAFPSVAFLFSNYPAAYVTYNISILLPLSSSVSRFLHRAEALSREAAENGRLLREHGRTLKRPIQLSRIFPLLFHRRFRNRTIDYRRRLSCRKRRPALTISISQPSRISSCRSVRLIKPSSPFMEYYDIFSAIDFFALRNFFSLVLIEPSKQSFFSCLFFMNILTHVVLFHLAIFLVQIINFPLADRL